MSGKVLVLGGINVDYVIHSERAPREGESLIGSDFRVNCGGKGANQAIAIAKLGCEVKIIGAVGCDSGGEISLGNLKSFGVDTSSVVRAGTHTGAALITVAGGDNRIVVAVGANDELTCEDIDRRREDFKWADIVVMQLEIPTNVVLYAAKIAKEYGKTVILNPAPVRDIDKEVYSYVDLVIPNEIEAELISGIAPTDKESTESALRFFTSLSAKNAIITLGDRGSAYLLEGEYFERGVYKVRRVDTTSAGDSFIGGLCVCLSEGKDLHGAIDYAAAVSAITVSREGASVSIPTKNEVELFLKSNSERKI